MDEARDEASTSLDLEGLSSHYDCVVLGTSLAPSIVAAAAAFSDHSVLHLDANDYYGHVDDASFTLDQAVDWAKEMMEAQQESGVDANLSKTALAGLGKEAVLDRVARTLATFRSSKPTPDPSSQGRGPDQDLLEESSDPDKTVADPVVVPSEEEVSLLSKRLSLRFLNPSPSQTMRMLSFGPSYNTEEEKPDSAAALKSEETDMPGTATKNEEAGGGDDDDDDGKHECAESRNEEQSATKPKPSGSGVLASPSIPTVVSSTSECGLDGLSLLPRLSMSDLEKASRRWSLDLGSPMALLCSGAAVELLVSSGVGRYLEFLAVDALCILENQQNHRQQQGAKRRPGPSAATIAAGTAEPGPPLFSTPLPRECWRVPSSKKDIFASKALGVLEKNRLMKLLRCCHDWGAVHLTGQDDLATQGDGELKSGRALSRPQNTPAAATSAKAATSAASSSSHQLPPGTASAAKKQQPPTGLDPGPYVACGARFQDFLDAWGLPPRLRDAVLYAIALTHDTAKRPPPGLAAAPTASAAAAAAAAAAATTAAANRTTG